jgi:hypothetical protein
MSIESSRCAWTRSLFGRSLHEFTKGKAMEESVAFADGASPRSSAIFTACDVDHYDGTLEPWWVRVATPTQLAKLREL